MVKGEMIIAMLCESMKWDYFTYEKQPTWFVEILLQKMEIDEKKNSVKSNHKGKRFK